MRALTIAKLSLLLGVLDVSAVLAQSPVTEDFTGASTSNSWYYSGGACLTASSVAGTGTEFTSTVTGTAGTIPGCMAIRSNSDAYGGETLVGGYSGTLPDTVSNGALRFTNGCINGNCTSGSGGGHNQFGAIISGNTFSSSAGVQVTFKTVTYRGDSQGAGGDGADGITFFLMDGSVAPNIGQYGGSLAYTCSNQNGNYGYTGMVGAYIGLGIDEYGNFLNGSSNTLGETGSTSTNGGAGDNTASGGLYQPNRIGLRGAGNIAYSWLSAKYPTYYPTGASSSTQATAVQNTCRTGTLWNFSSSSSGTNTGTTSYNGTTLLDYPAIPNAYKVLSGVTIANEYSNGGLTRGNATPILYKLKITTGGLLSLNYSFNGGAWQSVLQNQNITSSNGALPSTLRFGFAGSTGGSSNIHEVLCFKAASANTSSSSATTNQTQSSRVTSSTQAYFSYYDPNDWTGRLTANAVTSDSSGNLSISTVATWDASCVLTTIPTGSSCTSTGVAGPTTGQNPVAGGTLSRVILSWNGSAGIPFEWSSLSTAQQSALDQGDAAATANRLNYLRGVRTNEVDASGNGLYRDRDSVLGDIVDSSPVAVGQPVLPYAITWKDKLSPTTTMPENASGVQTYAQFITAEQQRENVVYVGANDGMVHGFRAGAYNSSNTYSNTTNDGTEVLAYFPGSTLLSAASSSPSTNCVSTVATQTTVQNIHGETPAITVGSVTAPACTQASLDYSNTQYGHNFFVDATPGTGDLFYASSSTSTGAWHTWLVGGLGAGGAALYALDVTTPANFSESTTPTNYPAAVVVGEWNASNITCPSTTGCANNLGNTYGTPLIRRLHNGAWAVIFGNGFGSVTGDAGVYIMSISPTTGAQTFYYLSTGTGTGTTAAPCSSNCNGIAYVSSVDLDGDHITDYLYAGDLKGNVWRFDLRSSSPSSWAASSAPLFSAGTGQPITSALLVGVVTTNAPGNQVIVAFGTGQKTPLTNVTSATYASAQQYLYAFWDWNFSAWNTAVPGIQYASLAASTAATGLSSPFTITPTNLTSQGLAVQTSGNVDLTSHTICWQGQTVCSTGNTSFGWSAALPGTSEQIIYNPLLVGGAFLVNSIIPAANTVLSCSTTLDSGYTYAISLASGGVAPATAGATSFFINTSQTNASTGVTTTVTNTDSNAAGIPTNATGTSTVMTTSTTASSASIGSTGTGTSVSCTLSGTCSNMPTNLVTSPSPFAGVAGCSGGNTFLVYQTTSGNAGFTSVTPKCPLTGSRLTRSQVR
jgi:type IV pilus assembly protein PilY1